MQTVLLVLALGVLVQLAFQLVTRKKQNIGIAIAATNTVIVAVSALFFANVGLFPSSGPPPKFDFPVETKLSLNTVQNCLTEPNLGFTASSSVSPSTSGGYNVEIVGRGLMLSGQHNGKWERVGFYIDIEELGGFLRVQFVGLQGQYTYSGSNAVPPQGERWEAFGPQEMAFLSSRIDGTYQVLADCMESQGHF